MRRVTFDIPVEIEEILRRSNADVGQAVKEAVAAEGYRAGRFGLADVAELLGLETTIAAMDWLAARGVPFNYTIEDLEQDRRTFAELERLGLLKGPNKPGTAL
jgi:predicted HTH domain antitoxin